MRSLGAAIFFESARPATSLSMPTRCFIGSMRALRWGGLPEFDAMPWISVRTGQWRLPVSCARRWSASSRWPEPVTPGVDMALVRVLMANFSRMGITKTTKKQALSRGRHHIARLPKTRTRLGNSAARQEEKKDMGDCRPKCPVCARTLLSFSANPSTWTSFAGAAIRHCHRRRGNDPATRQPPQPSPAVRYGPPQGT